MIPFSHWWRRLFKGPIVEALDTHYGVMRRYRSDYLEFFDPKTGQTKDVAWDMHCRRHHRRDWKCSRVGGGGEVTFHRTTLDQALRRCATTLGTIVRTDEYHGFIFYRDGAATPGELPVNPPH